MLHTMLAILAVFPALLLRSPDSAGGRLEVAGDARPEKEHARPRLVAEKTAVAPGTTLWIGVTFEMDEGWHIYWDGQNDSGLPVSGPWELPAGVTMGALHWPTPKRAIYPHIQAIDYTYEKKVTAIAELTVGESVKPDQTIKIDARLKWLVCQEQCKPGSQAVSLELKVVPTGSTIKESADAALFTEARKSIPKAVKEGEAVLSRRWDGNTLILAAQDAAGLVFYPDAKCATMTDAIGQGESKTGELKLGFEARSGTVGTVSGIVEVRRASPKPSEYYLVSVPGKERKE